MNTDLYRHFDSNGNLLYVGISLSTLNRLGQHKDNSHWFNSISNITIEKFNNRDKALIAERDAIINEKPLYNKVYNRYKYCMVWYIDMYGELTGTIVYGTSKSHSIGIICDSVDGLWEIDSVDIITEDEKDEYVDIGYELVGEVLEVE